LFIRDIAAALALAPKPMDVRPDTPKVKKFWRLFTMKPAPTLDSPEKVATGLLPAAVTPWTTTWPVTVAIPATTSWLMAGSCQKCHLDMSCTHS